MIGLAKAMKMAGVVEMGTGFVRRKARSDQEERVLPQLVSFVVSARVATVHQTMSSSGQLTW